MSKPSRLEKTAFHEAGHAVAAYLLRRRFGKVTIVPEGDNLGSMAWPAANLIDPNVSDSYDPKTRTRMEADIMIDFAGAAAEGIFAGRHNWKGAVSDNHNAIDYAESLVSSEDELEAYIGWLWLRARNLIQSPPAWAAVQALAIELLKNKTVGYRQARQIIAKGIRGQS